MQFVLYLDYIVLLKIILQTSFFHLIFFQRLWYGFITIHVIHSPVTIHTDCSNVFTKNAQISLCLYLNTSEEQMLHLSKATELVLNTRSKQIQCVPFSGQSDVEPSMPSSLSLFLSKDSKDLTGGQSRRMEDAWLPE